jgi:hypothetical protein
MKTIPKEYKVVKHPITGEETRIHGKAPYSWAFTGKRGTGYKGLGKQIPIISVTPDKIWYNIETGETKVIKEVLN